MDPVASKPRLNVAFIGHHHDGKTTLVAALLARLAAAPGCAAQALSVAELDQVENPEWREWRPLFRELGPVTVRPRRLSCETTRRTLGLTDCPGLRRRIKQTAWAVAAVDVAVLVVAADAGPRAQTEEHVRLAAAAGVRRFVVFVNKCDLLTDEARADEVELELRELVERCAEVDGDELRVIRGSAARALGVDPLWHDGVRRLIESLEDDIPLPRRDTDASGTQIVIDRVYPTLHRQKPRVLTTATIVRGRVAAGDRLVRVGLIESRVVQVQSLEVDGRSVPEALAGDHVGLVLRPGDQLTAGSLPLHEFTRGQRLVHPGVEDERDMFCARVQLVEVEHGGRHTPLTTGHHAQVLLGAAAVEAELTLIEGGALEPGGAAEVLFQLGRPLHVELGMRFVFRDGTDGMQWIEGGPHVWGGTAGHGEIYQLGVPPGTGIAAQKSSIWDRLKS